MYFVVLYKKERGLAYEANGQRKGGDTDNTHEPNENVEIINYPPMLSVIPCKIKTVKELVSCHNVIPTTYIKHKSLNSKGFLGCFSQR